MQQATDDYSPRFVGDTSKPLRHTFTDQNNNPIDLTGVNAAGITFRLRNLSTNVVRTGQGIWTITVPATSGKASYAWHPNDVAQEGPHEIQAMVPFPDGNQHFESKILDFLAVV